MLRPERVNRFAPCPDATRLPLLTIACVKVRLQPMPSTLDWSVGGAVLVVLAACWLLRRGRATPATGTGDLLALRPRAFEGLVREAFLRQGYQLIASPGATPVVGELLLRRDRETVLVDCRHWRDGKVGLHAVQALQQSMALRGAGSGFLVSTGRFGRDAVSLARQLNVRLVDGAALGPLLQCGGGPAFAGAANR